MYVLLQADIRNEFATREAQTAADAAKVKEERIALDKEQGAFLTKLDHLRSVENQAQELSKQVRELSLAKSNLQAELASVRERQTEISDHSQADRQTMEKYAGENVKLRSTLEQAQKEYGDARRDWHARAGEQEKLIRSLGERIAELQSASAKTEFDHAAEVAELRQEPDRAAAQARELWRWQEAEWRRQKHVLQSQLDESEHHRSQLRRKTEELEAQER